MTIAILIVCLTAPKSVHKCQLNFKATAQNPVEYKCDPRSVVVEDFNNDTWPDIAVANHAADNITIFFGRGDGTMTSPIAYSTGFGSAPYMLAVGDFNSDHRLDIVVANFGTNTVGIFLGSGDGSFPNQITFSTGSSGPLWIKVTDLNNDTALDIVIVNYGNHSISVVYGYGNATFSLPVTYSTGYDSFPMAVVAGDFDNDNQLDLVIANYGTNNIGVLFGSVTGTFTNRTTFSTGLDSHPYSLTVGHFNNDTVLDIAVANYGTNNVGVFLGYGNGTFKSQITYSIGTASPYWIDVGDLNNDHRLDLVVTNKGTNNIGVFFGYGNGTFGNPVMYSTGSLFSISFAINDFNKDNRSDIIVVNNDTSSTDILFGYDEGALAKPTAYFTNSTVHYSSVVAVGDFDNDTKLDIVVAGNVQYLAIFRGYSNGTFASPKMYSTGSSDTSAIAVGDFNNDNQLDIILVNSVGSDISVLLGYGNGSFKNPLTFSSAGGCLVPAIAIGDFDNDSRLDIVLNDCAYDNLQILLGYGNGSFTEANLYPTGSGSSPYSVTVGDVSNDNRLDILVVYAGAKSVGVFLGLGNGTFMRQMTLTAPQCSSPGLITVGDLNNDSRLDIVGTSLYSQYIDVFLGYDNDTFAEPTSYWIGANSDLFSTVIGDLNNDKRLDIVSVDAGTNNIVILNGHGDGTFANQRTYSSGQNSPSSLAVGDFNKDGRLDIVVAFLWSSCNISVFLGFYSGALENRMTLVSNDGSHLQYIAGADLNHDQQLDIAIANYGSNNVHVIFGYANGTFGNQTILTTGSSSHPYSIGIGDFNQDARMDIVVANYGTKNIGLILGNENGTFLSQTTHWTDSPFAPSLVDVGDFNNDGRSDIAVAYYDTDDVSILLGYDNAPFRAQRSYATNPSTADTYSVKPVSVAVGDFNNDDYLDIVVVSSRQENVSIFLGDGNGYFASQRTVLIGSNEDPDPLFVAVGDFNNDIRLDIVVIDQSGLILVLFGDGNGSFVNQTTFEIESPTIVIVGDLDNDRQLDIIVGSSSHYVGVLLGYGNGTFRSLMTYNTNGQSNSVALGDFNGDRFLDIIVASYDDSYVSVLLGYGNGSFKSPVTTETDSPIFVAVGDFDNDTRLDIVVCNPREGNIGVLFGYANGSFGNLMTYQMDPSSEPVYVTAGDLNNDNRLDIVVAKTWVQNIDVFLGYGNGAFAKPTTYQTGHSSFPNSLALGDLNNDNRLDIVVTNSEANNIGIFLGYANEAFINQTTLITGNNSRPRSFAFGDFDNNNQLDIAVANSKSDNVGVFLGYGYGDFTKQITFSTGIGSRPYSIATADCDNDTQLDIIVANYDSNSIGVFLGYGNGSFTVQKIYTTGSDSRPYSVAIGDFNNDAIPDTVVANYGTSSVYIFIGYGNGTFADPSIFSLGYGSLPFLITAGDYNNANKLDFVVANYGKDNLNVLLQTC